MAEYAHPDVLVTTDWVEAHLGKPGIKLVEIDVDTQQYDAGHIPGAVGFNWQTQLQDPVRRDLIGTAAFERLVGGAGITPDDTVIIYGDSNNWFAAYGFWLFKVYGHRDVRLMNGGRLKWLNEPGKRLVVDKPTPAPVTYTARTPDSTLRALLPEVLAASRGRTRNLVDVRSADEFSGKVIAPPGMSETAQRGGHIPGAKSIPWSSAVGPDGTFKPREELERLYFQEKGVDRSAPTIAYCRIGERSSHTWFVLKYLLGLSEVKNYDGSWTEYGNLVAMDIER